MATRRRYRISHHPPERANCLSSPSPSGGLSLKDAWHPLRCDSLIRDETFINWEIKRDGEVAWISSELLHSIGDLVHGITIRQPDRESNFSMTADPVTATQSRDLLRKAIHHRDGALIMPRQIHGTDVIRISEAGLVDQRLIGDSLITNQPWIVLGIVVADCVPVFVVDAEKRAIGLAHSGWRGTAGNVVKKMVDRMVGDLGCNPRNCLAAIGPGIGGKCYEVGEEVWRAMEVAGAPMSTINRLGNGKAWVDLKAIISDQLVHLGVRTDRIATYPECSHCRRDLFYSHRGGDTNRMAAFIGMKSNE